MKFSIPKMVFFFIILFWLLVGSFPEIHECSGTETASRFIKMLNDTSMTLVYHAKDSLIKMGNPAVYKLIKILQDTSATLLLKNRAAWVLKEMGPKAAIALPTIKSILKDSAANFDFRRTAIEICGSIGPDARETVPELIKFLNESRFESYREAAASALGRIGPSAKDAVPHLIRLMKNDWNEAVRIKSQYALARIGEPAVDELSDLFSDSSESHFLRAKIAEIFTYMGPKAINVLPLLISAVSDTGESEDVRIHAAEAIGEIGPQADSAINPLIYVMAEDKGNGNVSHFSKKALIKIGKPAVPELMKLIMNRADLSIAGSRLRENAVYVLGEIKPPDVEVVEFLTGLLNEAGPNSDIVKTNEFYDVDFKQEIAEALGKFGALSKKSIPALLFTTNMLLTNLRYSAAVSIIKIAEACLDAKDTDALPLLKIAYDSLSIKQKLGYFSFPELIPEDLARMNRAIQALELIEEKSSLHEITIWYSNTNKFFVLIFSFYLLLIVMCLVLLWKKPIWILKINSKIPLSDYKIPNLDLPVPLKYFFIVGFFHYHQRVLDAWVESYLKVSKAQIGEKCKESTSPTRPEIRITLDDSGPKPFLVQDLRGIFSKKRICLLIRGGEESDRKSLACQIANAITQADKSTRLCPDHPMLPVFVEKGLVSNAPNHKDPLVETVRGELRVLFQEEEDPVNEQLVIHLLRKRRILVIINYYLAVSPKTRNLINPRAPDFPINALVATSDMSEELGGVNKNVISLQ